MSTLLVGLGHKAQQGKSTLAQMIHELAPAETKIYNFSDAIVAHARAFGLMGAKKNPQLLQTLGADIYRKHINADYWIRQLQYSIAADSPRVALVTGVRFTNEFEWIQENNGICVQVIRVNETGGQWISPDRPARHLSEVELDGAVWDYTVSAADGNLEELRKAANSLGILIKQRL